VAAQVTKNARHVGLVGGHFVYMRRMMLQRIFHISKELLYKCLN